MIAASDEEEEPAEQRRRAHRREQSRTILVSLLHADGSELSPEEAAARLAVARRNAEPQDVVMGVRRRLDEESP
jgi:hypothetical protein